MSLRMFSVIGEALHFGGRRLGLIARTAWLPMLLLLVVDMATIFSYASVIAGRVITFTDVVSFAQVESFAALNISAGWENAPGKIGLIMGVSLVFQIILVSTFMAPLIRYVGLGERPLAGLFQMSFGADQLRFILSGVASSLFIFVVVVLPIAVTCLFIIQYIVEALTQTMASFPNPDSLHTIEIIPAGQGILERGSLWVYDLAIPLVAAAPFAIMMWVISVLHFHPRNRPNAGEDSNVFLRSLTVLAIGALVGGISFWLLRNAATVSIAAESNVSADAVQLAGSPVTSILVFAIVSIFMMLYFNIRLFAYPGVAVCQGSLRLGPTLAASRGWNVFKLPIIIMVLMLFLAVLQLTMSVLILPFLSSTLTLLFHATEASTRLVNSGVKGEWVYPLFVWLGAISKIIINLLVAFFNYGVLAALYGRLYRDSAEAG